MNDQLRRDAAKLRELAGLADSVAMIPTDHTAKVLRGIADNIVAAVEAPSVDARLANHEQRLGNLERTNPFMPAKPPLLHHTCKCDERPSTFNSAAEGPIPLSFKGRHLMMGLRDAIADAENYGFHTPGLVKARAAVARRMGELEARNGEADTFKSALSICQNKLKAAQIEIESLRRDLVHAKTKAESGFIPGRNKLVVYKLGVFTNRGCSVTGTTWDGKTLGIYIA